MLCLAVMTLLALLVLFRECLAVLTPPEPSSTEPSRSSPSRSSLLSQQKVDPSVVRFLAFPREFLQARLKRFASDMVEKRMSGWSKNAAVKACSLDPKCSVQFECSFGAHEFLDPCKDYSVFYQESDVSTEIRVRPDRSA